MGNPQKKERVILPTVDFHSRAVGDNSNKDRVTIFVYEIKYTLKTAYILKNLLYKLSSDNNTFRLIHYISTSVTTPTIMRHISFKYNRFLKDMVIVPIMIYYKSTHN